MIEVHGISVTACSREAPREKRSIDSNRDSE